MRSLYLAGASLLPLAAPAQSAPHHHAHKAATNGPKADPRDVEIKALEAKVDALTDRLDREDAAERAVAQQAETAKSAAAAAQHQTATALTQTTAAEAQVAGLENEVSPLENAIKDGWFANTRISGRAFFNVSNIRQVSVDASGVRTENGQNGTESELKRFYVSVDHQFSDIFSSDVTTDFRYNSNGIAKDSLLFVKKAYLQAKLSPAFIVRIGSAELPWAPLVENLYGFRFVENTLIDRTRFGTTTDWGVHVGGSLANGMVTYAVSAIDGAGYKMLSRGSDTIDLEGRIGFNPLKNIALALGGYTGKLGRSAANLSDSATPHTARRFDAVAAYTDKRVHAGLEYFAARNWNSVTSAAPDKSNGWSAFGSFAFTPSILAFGRFDRVRPSKDINPMFKDRYFNLGFDYKPLPPLDFALVYKRERASHGLLATSNGTIGGPDYGTYGELGLFGQLAF